MKNLIIVLVMMISVLSCKNEPKQNKNEEHGSHVNSTEKDETPKKKVLSPHTSTMAMIGDAHIHTRLSVDASLWGTNLGPDDVQRFARGAEVTSAKGWKVKLQRPLDWTVVADHSDGMGFYQFISEGADFIVAEP